MSTRQQLSPMAFVRHRNEAIADKRRLARSWVARDSAVIHNATSARTWTDAWGSEHWQFTGPAVVRNPHSGSLGSGERTVYVTKLSQCALSGGRRVPI